MSLPVKEQACHSHPFLHCLLEEGAKALIYTTASSGQKGRGLKRKYSPQSSLGQTLGAYFFQATLDVQQSCDSLFHTFLIIFILTLFFQLLPSPKAKQ